MSNSMNDDYFSFMSNKGQDKQRAGAPPRAGAPRAVAPAVSAVRSTTDSIEFVEDGQIEVTESFVSDTTIQRIFKQFQPG